MLSCQEAAHHLSESLDRDLSWRQRMAVRMHLLFCKFCRRFARQLALIRQMARSRPDEATEPRLSNDARQRIKQTLTGLRDQ